jgi:hypothetical protein
MHKADFEKKVQQKMQELRFHPSDKVWKGVEATISKEKRRRPLAFWLLIGATLLGGTYYFISNSTPSKIVVVQSPQPGQSIAEEQKHKPGESQESRIVKAQKERLQIIVPHARDESTQIEKTLLVDTRNPIAASVSNSSVPKVVSITENTPGSQVEITRLDAVETSEEMISVERTVRAAHPLSLNSNERTAYEFHLAANGNSDLPFIQTNATVQHASVKKTNWSFGITVSAGRSDLDDQPFKSAAAAGMYYDPLASNSGNVNHKPSDIKPSGSFSLGAYAARSLGNKTRLGLGISYQYFSNTIQVGAKVDSVVVVNQNSFAMDRVNEYYKSANSSGGSDSGSAYCNQYHYFSLPFSFQWQFFKRLTWENQLVYSHMIKTNALHFDGATGAYYQNKDLFNKNQFFGSTAVLFSLWNNKVKAGPQLEYAFTNLLKSGINNSRHLRSLNLKANIDLWKY